MAPAQSDNFQCATARPQTPTGQKVMENVFFCTNANWRTEKDEYSFDYIVVGTGPCGLAFVDRVLSQKPKARILMIERGGYFLPEHFQNLPTAFASAVGGMAEIFPWNVAKETRDGKYIKFHNGTVPFFGGKSILWSAWCPRPNNDEFTGWPQEIVETANRYYSSAEALMNVVEVGLGDREDCKSHMDESMHPIYSTLQMYLTKRIVDNLSKVSELTRAMAAPLAVGAPMLKGIKFAKFSSPGPLLELVEKQNDAAKLSKGEKLKIVTDCVVEKIYNQNGQATALQTSRGVLDIGDAKLILAMGAIPPSTLIQNSFSQVPNVGEHLSAHFISAIIARIPEKDFDFPVPLTDIELGAMYVAGIRENHNQQFHVQLSAFYDIDPATNSKYTFQYAPDVLASASKEQLATSKGYVVFVLACLGELEVDNKRNATLINSGDSDPTKNVHLNLVTDENDEKLWDVMDESSFQLLETIISPNGNDNVEYWHGKPDDGDWLTKRPPVSQIRVPGTVHDSSTLIIGDPSKAANTSVGLDYRPHGVENVYVTGGSLWPRAGSWNPTLTMVALSQHLADTLI